MSLFKAERQKEGTWLASAKEANGLSKRVDKSLAGDSIGLLVSKFALLGDEDALAVVGWMTEKLYPESLTSDMADDVIKQNADMRILEDEKYLEIFRVVYENKVVFADEMDRVLNPILSDRVIAFVNGAGLWNSLRRIQKCMST